MAVKTYEVREIIKGRLLNYRKLQRMSSKELAKFIGEEHGLITVDKEIRFRIEYLLTEEDDIQF